MDCIAYNLESLNPELRIGAPLNQEENCGSEEELKDWEDRYSAQFAGSPTYIYCMKRSGKDTTYIVKTTR
ncbi:hypothetical protein [Desertivirga arenae]|uniref:hypothetical protein n=1 Tax=Desertivirga arenae TaxID=2810309 RepID=UPI001A972765|nr:hypothetical protein [Pedobacter sp. SYSU D00823]